MKRILAFVLLFALCLLGGCAKQPSYFVEFTLSQNAYSQGVKLSQSQLSELRGEISELLHEIESQVSTEIEGSDLSRINAAAAGEEIEVGEHTAAMLEICSRLYERTGGAFSPALYNLSQLWGFTPEFEGKYSVPRPEPSAEAIAEALADSSFADIEINGNVVVKHNGAVKLDLGGIAKGYMSDLRGCRTRLSAPVRTITAFTCTGIRSINTSSILLQGSLRKTASFPSPCSCRFRKRMRERWQTPVLRRAFVCRSRMRWNFIVLSGRNAVSAPSS